MIAAGITEMGIGPHACARRHAYQADPRVMSRGRTERKHRRVGLRPRPDTMASLTGYLPAEQAVACYAALRRRTDAHVAAGDTAAATRSWPTPWSNCSPAKPKPATSTSKSS